MRFSEIWNIVGPHSQLGETRSRYLHGLLRLSPDCGFIAEVGVFEGWTAKLIQLERPNSPLHLFDTFDGIKKSDPSTDRHRDGDFKCSIEDVTSIVNPFSIFHPGLFPETFQSYHFTFPFAFCHVDTDTYFGTKSSLDSFWPNMAEGGIMLFDDYKFDPCPGVEKALHEWSDKTGVEIMIAPSGGQAWIIK